MKVLEISAGVGAAYAGLLLAQLGYRVERVDLRSEELEEDPFLHRDRHDLSVVPALDDYDAIVEDVGPEVLGANGISYAALRRRYPRLVVVSLSGFGLNGPYRDWETTDLVVQAAGGVLHVTGYDGEPPRKLPGDAAAMISGVHGATAVVSAVHGVQQGVETGIHIDISAQDALMHHWTRHVSEYAHGGALMRRAPREPQGIPARNTAMAQDGWLFLLALGVPWQDIAAFLGLGEFVDFDAREQPWGELEAAFHEAVAGRTRYAWFEEAAAMGWTFAPVQEPQEVLASAQSEARGFREEQEIDGRRSSMPGMPFHFRR